MDKSPVFPLRGLLSTLRQALRSQRSKRIRVIRVICGTITLQHTLSVNLCKLCIKLSGLCAMSALTVVRPVRGTTTPQLTLSVSLCKLCVKLSVHCVPEKFVLSAPSAGNREYATLRVSGNTLHYIKPPFQV